MHYFVSMRASERACERLSSGLVARPVSNTLDADRATNITPCLTTHPCHTTPMPCYNTIPHLYAMSLPALHIKAIPASTFPLPSPQACALARITLFLRDTPSRHATPCHAMPCYFMTCHSMSALVSHATRCLLRIYRA